MPPAPFLVRSEGAEVGVRTQPNKGLTSTFSVFLLDFDSELVFVGDAGTTEASRPSRRIGAEFTLSDRPTPWLTLDLDAAYTYARFRTEDARGARPPYPGRHRGRCQRGTVFDDFGGWFGGAKVALLRAAPLIEDNTGARSSAPCPPHRLQVR